MCFVMSHGSTSLSVSSSMAEEERLENRLSRELMVLQMGWSEGTVATSVPCVKIQLNLGGGVAIVFNCT